MEFFRGRDIAPAACSFIRDVKKPIKIPTRNKQVHTNYEAHVTSPKTRQDETSVTDAYVSSRQKVHNGNHMIYMVVFAYLAVS